MEIGGAKFDPIMLGWLIGMCILWAINAWRGK